MTATWDLGSYFPAFDGPEYKKHLLSLRNGLEDLGVKATQLGAITQENVPDWVDLFVLDEQLMERFSHVASYIGCLSAADVTNEAYKAADAAISMIGAAFSKAMAPVIAALKTVEDGPFAALLARPELAGAGFQLSRLRQEAAWSLEPSLEILSADLGVDGIGAWGRLYNELAGRLTFFMPTPDGKEEQVPMAQKRALLEDEDAEVRKLALVRSNQAWQEVEHVAAAALNAISGTRLTMYRHRGIDDFLEKPFFDARVQRRTVDAMWQSVAENKAIALGIMQTKAQCLGKQRLGFQDLQCPLPQAKSERYSWEQGCALVAASMDARYPKLGAFVREMLEKRHVESEKRPGKRPGAFCTTSLQSRESFVFMSFGGGMGDVQTLAHELGHAFHGRCLSKERPFAARYPMTLAETASTFAERILQDAVLASPDTDDRARLAVLNARCSDAVTFMCDIRMRYDFEKAFYEARKEGEVGVSRIKELMLDAQKNSFGQGLDPETLDPMFWASKLHFYITGVSFYNFPYTFGFLFSLGLAAQLEEKGDAFLPEYEELLRLTGAAECEEVVQRSLGKDIGTTAFWQQALDRIAQDAQQYRELAERLA